MSHESRGGFFTRNAQYFCCFSMKVVKLEREAGIKASEKPPASLKRFSVTFILWNYNSAKSQVTSI